MSFFDKLKNLFKKPKIAEKKPPKPKPKKPVRKVEKPKPVKKPKISRRRVLAEASKIILSPLVTEKITDLSKENKYVFKVSPKATKPRIVRVIEALYGVKIIGVNIINIHRKARRIGRTSGFKPGYKKAIVTLAPGQKIEVVKGV